uniref:Matrix metallopeptidase 2 n=1 Tax=Acartia pacifica TaxID=335913 RepID=A0A0U2V1I7_ACAPC|nr:matrix metallopeptidase 2 [Acartia pacifica]ALS04429.1 matrix metallopeptidase 2 [Acartia pacifica]
MAIIVVILAVSLACTYAQEGPPPAAPVTVGPNGETLITAPLPELTCTTDVASRCVFPFRFNGVLHQQCAPWVWGGENEGRHWCSLITDNDNNHINEPGNYHFCDCCSNVRCGCPCPCQTTTDAPPKACVFPFRFNGELHQECAPWVWGGDNQGRHWCSTNTDSNNNHVNEPGNWGFCNCWISERCGCPSRCGNGWCQ